MSLLRNAAVKLGNAMPAGWKRYLKWELSIPDMSASLAQLRERGFAPRVVLDIGAYVGDWTRACRSIWPSASVCMFEPLPDTRPILDAMARATPGLELRPLLLSDRPANAVPFYTRRTGSSLFPAREGERPLILASTTLDAAVAGSTFSEPRLIKLDVQGAELLVLRGGERTLASAEVVILEVSLQSDRVDLPLFADVVRYMAERDLHAYDVCTIWRNTPTKTMNQADIIFVRADSPLRDVRNYVW